MPKMPKRQLATICVSGSSLISNDVQGPGGQDVHPPLYYVLLKVWERVFGESLWAVRGLSVLFGAAAVLVAYAVCVEALRGLSWRENKGDADGTRIIVLVRLTPSAT